MKVTIIGGGIGGLTTALALKRAGIPFVLYEAAAEIKSVGAGIIMANNALQVFRELGIHEEIYRLGNKIDTMHITKADLSPLSSIGLQRFEKFYGLQNHAIHRSDLYQILVTAVGAEHIRINKRLERIEKEEDGYRLAFADGSIIRSEYVIGADGIKSQVRQQLFPGSVYRDTRQICWRGVTSYQLPERYRHEVVEAWHRGLRAGFVQTSADKVYWYLVINAGLEIQDAGPEVYTRDFHPLIAALVAATPPDTLIKAPLYDLKPIHTWSDERVCLVGDAAHATSPNLGQGACQAVEDAYVLGELMKQYSIPEAFEKYPELRRAKAHYVVKTSWQVGVLSQLENRAGIGVRNFILKYLTPESVNIKQMARLFKLPVVS